MNNYEQKKARQEQAAEHLAHAFDVLATLPIDFAAEAIEDALTALHERHPEAVSVQSLFAYGLHAFNAALEEEATAQVQAISEVQVIAMLRKLFREGR